MTTTTTGPQRTSGCPVHHGYEPFDQTDPFPAYARLRTEEPVFLDDRTGYWVVTRYDDVKAVFGDWETFSSDIAQQPVRERGPEARRIMEEGGFTAYSGLSARVPPDHTRIRKAVGAGFTPRRYRALEPVIRAICVDRLERMLAAPDREADLVEAVANRVPVATILALIGVDTDIAVETFKRWSDSRAALTWGNLDDEAQVPHARNLVEYWRTCQDLVREAHETDPDSLVGDLVRAQRDGEPITDHEIASACYSLLFAGHETTTTLIANCFRLLLGHRESWDALVADPALIPAALEEVLRVSPSITAWRRRATRDAVVGGVPVPADARLLLVMGSANRDESRFPDPETFDIRRDNAREHLAFGFGIHYCLGNKLAKLQTGILLEEAVRLVPQVRLVDGQSFDYPASLGLRAPRHVRVAW